MKTSMLLAFMDIMPAVEGHTLEIPKEAGETLFDISPEAASATIRTTQKVAAAVQEGAPGVLGVMLAQLCSTAAGADHPPHVHFHILPRSAGADLHFHGKAMVGNPRLWNPSRRKSALPFNVAEAVPISGPR